MIPTTKNENDWLTSVAANVEEPDYLLGDRGSGHFCGLPGRSTGSGWRC